MTSINTPWFNNQDPNFFNVLNKSKNANVVLCAETEDFDEQTIQQWVDEGFRCAYCPLLKGGQDFINRIHSIGDNFGVSEQYAIVAYGDAASLALEAHTKPNHPELIALVAYYPSRIPSIHTKYPASIQVLVHLAGTTIGVDHHPEVLGIQGRKKTVPKRIDPGLGHGERLTNIAFKTYTYTGLDSGFAESDLEEYDSIAAELAFTRSLTTIRKGFRLEPDIELLRDQHTSYLQTSHPEKALSQTHDHVSLLHTPTLTGANGKEDLTTFYKNYFTPLPPSSNQTLRLLSRTISPSRLIDELYLSLTHTTPIPWLLPGVPPTHKKIEIAIISIFHIKGTKLQSEHIYWDQASVLLQAGLLDLENVSEEMREKGMKKLPVVGGEAARAIRRASSRRRVNELIEDW